jgi:hypothetical protein
LSKKDFSALGINQPNAVTGKWTNEKFSFFFFFELKKIELTEFFLPFN